MKTIPWDNRTAQALLPMSGAVLVLALPWMSTASGIAWSAYLVVGATYMTATIARDPARWQSRRGSLLPAVCLGAFLWLVAGFTIAVAFLPRH